MAQPVSSKGQDGTRSAACHRSVGGTAQDGVWVVRGVGVTLSEAVTQGDPVGTLFPLYLIRKDVAHVEQWKSLGNIHTHVACRPEPWHPCGGRDRHGWPSEHAFCRPARGCQLSLLWPQSCGEAHLLGVSPQGARVLFSCWLKGFAALSVGLPAAPAAWPGVLIVA